MADRVSAEEARKVVASKLAIALACRAAMQEHRRGKPVAFQPRTRP